MICHLCIFKKDVMRERSAYLKKVSGFCNITNDGKQTAYKERRIFYEKSFIININMPFGTFAGCL